MKSLLLSCILFLLSFSLSAQFSQGEIVYESKINVHKNLPDEMAHMKDEIPEFRTSKHILNFTPTESYFYRKRETATEAAPSGIRGRGMRGRRNRDNTKLYTDLTTRISLESKEFFGKQFLIEGESSNYKWKFTGKSKQVGSYFCQQAIHQDTTEKVEVWFTPMIPVSAGPENFTGLPGLILHVDINDGDRVITALEVGNKEIEEGSIVKPTEGKPISRTEYREMTREKMKEMEQEYGGKRRGWHKN